MLAFSITGILHLKDERPDDPIITKAAGSGLNTRAASGTYVAILFVVTFFGVLAFYFGAAAPAALAVVVAWLTLPLLAWRDRIAFDGKRIHRTGLVPKVWSAFNQSRCRLKLSDVEMVETFSTVNYRRGGRAIYRHRSIISGKGATFVLASANGFRRTATAIFAALPEDILDARSLELRDHFVETRRVLDTAEKFEIPSADVLEHSLKGLKLRRRHLPFGRSDVDRERALELRLLANQLHTAGYTVRAAEAFRRAVVMMPDDGWLIYEFGKCLVSLGGWKRDPRLMRRGMAMLRLAERLAGNDRTLLERIGQSYIQIGHSRRAESVFARAVECGGETFRLLRGQADIALNDGKLAHVIHKLGAAADIAVTPSLKRWAKGEYAYFTRLSEDEEYMELEISRMNLADSLASTRRTAFVIALVAFPVIGVGMYLTESIIADIGWAISGIALAIWMFVAMGGRIISSRIPLDLMDDERDRYGS